MPIESFFRRNEEVLTVVENDVLIFEEVAVKAGETIDAQWNVCVAVKFGKTALDAVIRIAKNNDFPNRVDAPLVISTTAAFDKTCATVSYKATPDADAVYSAKVFGSKKGNGEMIIPLYSATFEYSIYDTDYISTTDGV